MAVKTKQELLASINARLGDDKSDDAIALIEDITDTYDALDSASKENTDWKKKYEDNDAEWRDKYRNRFFNAGNNEDDDNDDPDNHKKKPMRFEDLFKEG